jgi:hypothetical protein
MIILACNAAYGINDLTHVIYHIQRIGGHYCILPPEKRHKCQWCGYKFSSFQALEKHLKSTPACPRRPILREENQSRRPEKRCPEKRRPNTPEQQRPGTSRQRTSPPPTPKKKTWRRILVISPETFTRTASKHTGTVSKHTGTKTGGLH